MGNMLSFLREDSDKLLSYNTRQQVSILDAHLGVTHLVICILILAYVIGYDLIYCEGYFVYESARGIVVTQNAGDSFTVSSGKIGQRYFAPDEIGYPGLENGNRFVATKVVVHKQTRGNCTDKSMPCFNDKDCYSLAGGVCQDSGFCSEPSWCETTEGPAEIYELPTDSHLIWVKSAIQFIQLDKNKLFLSDMVNPTKYPSGQDKDFSDYNTFSVRDILNKCEPPVRYEEISELGAAIEMQLVYNCNMQWGACKPEVKARRMDTVFAMTNIGFGFKLARYETDDDNVRELLDVRGVRIYFRAVGTGRKVAYIAIVMRLSTALALLGTSCLFTDFLMLHLFARKVKYYARKYVESTDFSNYFDEVAAQELSNPHGENFEEDAKVQAMLKSDDDDEEEREWQRRMDEDDT